MSGPSRPNKRVVNEIRRDNLICEYRDNEYLYIPIKLYPSLEKITKKCNIKPALNIYLKNYPFRVPQILYLSKSLDSIYHYNSIFFSDFKQITGLECLCCNSLICPINWGPLKTIRNIIEEFIEITSIKCRLVERIYCDKIQNQLIKSVNDGHENTFAITDIRIAEYL